MRIVFFANRLFTVGSTINISRVRLNANGAAGVGSVTATLSGFSSNPATNPISFSDPQRQVGVLSPAITADFNHSSATPSPITSFYTCAFLHDNLNDFFVRVNEVYPPALTTMLQEQSLSRNLLATNGTKITITITNIPAGLTLDAVGTQLSTGNLTVSLPEPSATVLQTVDGSPISITYTIINSDTSLFEQTTFPFSLKPTVGNSIPDVQSPITIQGAVQITPITTDDSTIVRFVSNQIGPTTLATISNCPPPPRPTRQQLISD